MQNIEKAKKEIERLEAEEAGETSGSSTPKKADGETKAVEEVTEAVKDTTLEEKTEAAEASA